MTVEERLAELERRLRRVEDELAISRLMASYGPLVDAGDGEAVAALWTEDGQYEVEGWRIVKRISRALDGSRQVRDLLAAGAMGRPA